MEASPEVAHSRFSAVDAALAVTVGIWSFNVVAQKYALSKGVQPIAFVGIRNGLAAALFVGATFVGTRAVRIRRADLPRIVLAALIGVSLTQILFAYGLHKTSATTVALILGTQPLFASLFAHLARVEPLRRRAMIAAVVSLGGVALVAFGSGGNVTGLYGASLALIAGLCWAAFSVMVVPLTSRYSAVQIGAMTTLIGEIPVVLIGSSQLRSQNYHLSWVVWAALLYAGGSLLVANGLWFRALGRVGPNRAILFQNLQPFLGAVFAVIFLSERLTTVQLLGGLVIVTAIVFGRRVARPSGPKPTLPG